MAHARYIVWLSLERHDLDRDTYTDECPGIGSSEASFATREEAQAYILARHDADGPVFDPDDAE